MQPMNAPRKADPAPSRWSYRLQRLMLTPIFRLFLRVGLPVTLSFLIGTVYMADQARRENLSLAVAEIWTEIENRPEFMVNAMAVDGVSPELNREIRAVLPVELPTSSFDLDLAAIRDTVRDLPAVKEVSVRIRNGGQLQIDVDQRVPAVLWRTREGLMLLDETGAHVAPAMARVDHPDLPIIAGAGADKAVPEAFAILAAARPFAARLRGLVRIGERRWNVELDRDQRIKLPATNPVQALERVIALDQVQDLLERDVAVIDVRLASRPTIKMNKSASEQWWRVQRASFGE